MLYAFYVYRFSKFCFTYKQLILSPDMEITDQINSFLKTNMQAIMGVNRVDRSSFAETVTYLFYYISWNNT